MSSSERAGGQEAVVVGLVADTHVPDRVDKLHPGLIPALREARVQAILHAGDICVRAVLDELGQVAPVTAVRGNRDWLAGPLDMAAEVEIAPVRLAVVHGHGGLLPYLEDKLQLLVNGYHLERYLAKIARNGSSAQAVIFGHTHHAVIHPYQGRLLINPGSASIDSRHGIPPSFGLLRVFPSGELQAQIVPLTGYRIHRRRWEAVDSGEGMK